MHDLRFIRMALHVFQDDALAPGGQAEGQNMGIKGFEVRMFYDIVVF